MTTKTDITSILDAQGTDSAKLERVLRQQSASAGAIARQLASAVLAGSKETMADIVQHMLEEERALADAASAMQEPVAEGKPA